MSSGGKSKGVFVVTDSDLEGSGGDFTIHPGKVVKVDGLPVTPRGVLAGKSTAVYVVDAAEAARRGVIGGESIPVADVTSYGRPSVGPHIAVPIYIMSGADNIGVP